MKKALYCFVFAAFLFSGFALLVHASEKAQKTEFLTRTSK